MTKDFKIKPNEELYGDFEPTPIPLAPVEERIAFFNDKMKETMKVHFMDRDNEALNKYTKAHEFWKEIKEKHCIKDEDEQKKENQG